MRLLFVAVSVQSANAWLTYCVVQSTVSASEDVKVLVGEGEDVGARRQEVIKELKLVLSLDKTSIEPEGNLSITNLDSNEMILLPLTAISDTLNSLSQGSSTWV